MATIGITDSGMGGLTILDALYRNSRNNNYIYLADIKNSPYGMKTGEEIIKLTEKCCDRLIELKADIIVIACNTATSAAIDTLRKKYSIEIVGTEPAVMPAIRDKHKKILVLGTPYTINSLRYNKLIENYEDRIINCPCYDLARMIDDAAPNFNTISDYVESILKPFKTSGAVVLGCTHYVLIKEIIHKIMPNTIIYDSSEGIVSRVQYLLGENHKNTILKDVQILSTDYTSMDNYYKVFKKLLE